MNRDRVVCVITLLQRRCPHCRLRLINDIGGEDTAATALIAVITETLHTIRCDAP